MTIEINQEVNNTRNTINFPLPESQDGISELIEIPRPPSELIEGRKISPQGKKYLRDVFPLIIENLSVQGFNTPEKVNESLTNLASTLVPAESEHHDRQVVLIGNSLKLRFKNLQRLEEFERLRKENSPWIETLGQIYEKVYSPESNESGRGKMSEAFFNNFASTWMLNVRERVREISKSYPNPEETFKEAERSLNEKIRAYLAEINPEDVRGKGSLGKILSAAISQGNELSLEEFIKGLTEERKVGQEVPNLQDIDEAIREVSTENIKEGRLKQFVERFRKAIGDIKTQKIVKRVATAAAVLLAGITLRSSVQPPSSFLTSAFEADKSTPQGMVQVKTPTAETPPLVTYTSTPSIPATSTPTPFVTAKAESTPTPSQEEEIFELTAGKPITITIDTKKWQLDLSFVPKDYKSEVIKGTGAVIEEMKSPDSRTGLPQAETLKDKHGNTWVLIDSGYKGTNPLGAEDERTKFEGGGINPKLPLLAEEEIEENLKNISNAKGIAKESNGKTRPISVAGAVRIPHELVEEFTRNTESAIQVIINLTGGANSPYNRFREPGSSAIFYVLCGWGPVDPKTGTVDRNAKEWWSWSRYVIVLEPADRVQKLTEVQIYP